MAKPWAEVEGSTQYQGLDDSSKQLAKQQYFQSVVAPKVPKEKIEVARSQFFAESKAPTAMDIPGGPGAAMGNRNAGVKPPERGVIDRLKGAGEAALTMGSGMAGGAVGGAVSAFDAFTNGKYGTQAGVKQSEQRGANVAEKMIYQPRTEAGKEYVGRIGDVVQQSGIAGLTGVGAETASLLKGIKPARAAFNDVANLGGAKVADGLIAAKDKFARKSSLSGVGAAMTPEATMRSERAASLPVPVPLTKGMKTRAFEQQQFEKETAKLPEGGPIRERVADVNEAVLKNFDAMDDLTGSQRRALRDVGKVVNDSLVEKQTAKKAQINEAYATARAGGELKEMIPLNPLSDYLTANFSSNKAAPVLSVIRSEMGRLSKGKKELSLDDLEQVRKLVNKASNTASDFTFGGEIKQVIDQMTEGKGGKLYAQARRLNENFKKEFKDKAVIANLLRNKRGTADRAVAFEDIYKSTILDGSLDDVRHVRRTLQTAGEGGQQAWKELQGATLRDLKEQATKSMNIDMRGNPVVSAAKVTEFINGLDKDGKLNFIFGKKGAEQLRDVAEIAKDIYTSPPGSVNHSNTAAALFFLLDSTTTLISGLPLPIASAVNYGVKKVKSRNLSARVTDALDDGLIPPRQ